MIDFNSIINIPTEPAPVNPIEIYGQLDRTAAVAGPLRPEQEAILKDWYENHFDDHDVILKMHTGGGKTLVGMLMLLSKLNKGNGACLYVCPNKQLAEQASADARKFGILHVLFKDGELPLEFIDGNKLMITHVQKVFNGLTKFGLENKGVEVDTFILDDSHACIDSIKSSLTITIPRNEDLFKCFVKMFETELRKQGEGTYYDIISNPYSSSCLAVPYWDWQRKTDDVLQQLMERSNENYIKFTLPLVRDTLRYCTMYVSGRRIEIVPYYPLIEKFTSFSKARQRILMSATTQDDSFFIRGLGLSEAAVQNPLTCADRKWAGEKMIIFPSIIDETLSQDIMRREIATPGHFESTAVTVLVPNFSLGENEYKSRGCYLVSKDPEMSEALETMKTGRQSVPIVFANRYDGIDLADDMCRVLVIDSIPVSNSLSDQYEESCRKSSDLINIKIAQKIEQGLGRSVRSERDYSVIVIIGADLVRFMKGSQTRKYFSGQTDMQIKIGEYIAGLSKGYGQPDGLRSIHDLVSQFLKRDQGWKNFYKTEMDKIEATQQQHPLLSLLAMERKADEAILKNDISAACNKYQEIADMVSNNKQEKGWYLQELAKLKNILDPLESKALQRAAYKNNQYVLMPDDNIYTKANLINDSQLKNIQECLKSFSDYQDFQLYTDEILSNLSWGVASDKFEEALHRVGILLGFVCQRPDKEIKKGPDNLWAIPDNAYLCIECKNQVDMHRDSISKREAGQMEMHAGWFEEEYGSSLQVDYMWIFPTSKISEDVTLSHEVTVITPDKLELFKKQLKSYFIQFGKYDIHAIEDMTIHQFIIQNSLQGKNLKSNYSECVHR